MTDLADLIDELETALAAPGFVPSPQQQAVFDWITEGQGNAIIVAVAGAGKTTTLIEASRLMTGRVAMCAYNKRIADEISQKLADRELGHVTAGTFHSFGFRAYRRVYPRVKVNANKLRDVVRERNVPWAYREFVEKLVSLARQQGVGISSDVNDDMAWAAVIAHFGLEETLDVDLWMTDYNGKVARDENGKPILNRAIVLGIGHARTILDAMNSTAHSEIDFDDMLYLPLALNLKIDKYDWVLVDEAQDSNATRRELARRMVNGTGRLIAVGDPHQAIYGFTGANADALDIIARDFNAIELPLTVTYRCPQAVVEVAHRYVSHIEAHPSAPLGHVYSLTHADFMQDIHSLDANDALLCRNTKPLVEMAYTLIRYGVACHVEGRDLGAGLIALTKKWKIATVDAFLTKLDDWADKECIKFASRRQDARIESVRDRVETIHVIAEQCPTGADLADLQSRITRLFEDSDAPGTRRQTFTLSTIHKAKGREWSTVYWYGAAVLQPSKYATRDWQMEQEVNLQYVAATRAKETLVEVAMAPLAPRRDV